MTETMTIPVKTAAGASSGSVEVPASVFGVEVNIPLMHQVVTAQLAAKRKGTHSTKTRAEVRGGGAKPWNQKGTGRARQGSIRAPHWRGGGIAHGPKPRDYSQKTPKKMIRLALCSALSDRMAEDRIVVIDDWAIDAAKTKRALEILGALGLRTKGEREDRVLLVVDNTEDLVWLSFRNLGTRVQLILPRELNAYDVLVNDYIVFSKPSLESALVRFTGGSADANDDATTDGGEA